MIILSQGWVVARLLYSDARLVYSGARRLCSDSYIVVLGEQDFCSEAAQMIDSESDMNVLLEHYSSPRQSLNNRSTVRNILHFLSVLCTGVHSSADPT